MRELDTFDLQIYDRPDLLITDLTQTQYLPVFSFTYAIIISTVLGVCILFFNKK